MTGVAAGLALAIGIGALEVPENPTRALGDVHPYGNPHYHLDPANAPIIARNIASGLSRVDQGNASYYEQRLADFSRRVEQRLAGWVQLLAPFRGIMSDPSVGSMQLMLSYVVALVVYVLLHMAVSGLLRLFAHRKSTI